MTSTNPSQEPEYVLVGDEPASLSVKMVYNDGTMRRARLANPTIRAIQECARRPSERGTTVAMRWKDEEGDDIVLATDAE